MTPTEINKAIHIWLGNDPINRYRDEADNLVQYLDYYNTSAAFDLLDELVSRGYIVRLQYQGKNVYEWEFSIIDKHDNVRANKLLAPSKSAAICLALVELIRKEQGDEL